MTGKLQPRRLELFVEKLRVAVSSRDPEAAPAVISKMREAQISSFVIADHYIPEVARRLGEAWCSDEMDFATVTIGSARLQGILRSLGPEWSAEDQHINPTAPRCMVIVPAGAQHTLGATILAGQLRRSGISVSLVVGAQPATLSARCEGASYDAFLISASEHEKLNDIKRIVEAVRSAGEKTPVIVGGNVLALAADVETQTGADLATSDVEAAIRFCGFDARLLHLVGEES
ncbi:MAG: cobalamin B12-binding domain-containing protein [Litoreibacter sp.]|nr:cobalamin B12-binding domain-containing protein [Litoreibacter sp.]